MDIRIVTVSEEGKVVIPSTFCKELSIGEGTQQAVYTDGTNLYLKPIVLPTIESLQETLDAAKAYAKEAGLTLSDVGRVIEEYRREKREGRA